MTRELEARAQALYDDLGDDATAELVWHLKSCIDFGYPPGEEPFGPDPDYQQRMERRRRWAA